MTIESQYVDMQNIVWRYVVGSGGMFEVSNRGKIRKAATGSLVKLTANDRGYLCCGVLQDDKRKVRKVHIMVAEAFIGPRPDGCELAFLDGVKANCDVANLRYARAKEHALTRLKAGRLAPSAKLTPQHVLEMRELIKSGIGFADIAAQYKVSYGNIKKISSRLTWDHI